MSSAPRGRAAAVFVFVAAALVLIVPAVPPLRAADAPPGGQPLISDPLTTFRASSARGSSSVVSARGPRFDRAIRTVVVANGEPWEVELRATVTRPVAAGDVGLLHFWARNADPSRSSQAVFTAYAQRASPNWTKSLYVDLAVGAEWTEYWLPWRWDASYGAGGSMLAFGLGRLAQTVEIGGLEVLDYGQAVSVDDLPRTAFSYLGREPNAPWRREAEQRIEQHRKGPLTVVVVNADGRPVRDVDVRVEMIRHAFPFGTALPARQLLADSDDGHQFRVHLLDLFNSATLENDLKWPAWEGNWGANFNRAQTRAALEWLRNERYQVRGHVLVWPGWDNLPQSITRHRSTPQAATAIPPLVLQHIDEITRATAGFIDEWDVVNEPYSNHDLMDLFGWQPFLDWFFRAADQAPDATLYLNDYAILSDHGVNFAHHGYNREILDWLVAEGVPRIGFGMQGHFGANPTSIPRVYEVLGNFATYGIPLRITEFDVATGDETLQADYTRDFLTMAFSHPAVAGVQIWGFWEGAIWQPEAAMYRRDWSEKPNGAAWRDLVTRRWRTTASGRSDRDGRFTTRAFYGDYRVTVSRGSQAADQVVSFRRDSGPLTVTVEGF